MASITPAELESRLAKLVMARFNRGQSEYDCADICVRGRKFVNVDIRAISATGIERQFGGFGELVRFSDITEVTFYAMQCDRLVGGKTTYDVASALKVAA